MPKIPSPLLPPVSPSNDWGTKLPLISMLKSKALDKRILLIKPATNINFVLSAEEQP